MILLVWCVRIEGISFDHYTTFETLADAQGAYDRVLEDPCTYSASLCKPFQSTEPHYLESETMSEKISATIALALMTIAFLLSLYI